jgi:hypothetical protein
MHTAPLAGMDWLLLLLLAAPIFIFDELYKWISSRG